MTADNEGFLYPEIKKRDCTGCGLCDTVCPIKNPVKEKPFEQEAYFVQNKCDDTLAGSTSGGFFSALAEYVISKNGIVYGAVLNKETLKVEHIGVNRKDLLWRFRKSKYVQSDTKDTFKEAKQELDAGRLVCYSGTPCQIEGLKKYLRKDYENLITCDVVCHSVPSPLVLKKYIEFVEQMKEEPIADVIFRDKSVYGYKYNVITAYNKKNRKIYQCGVESDPYLRAFFMDVSVRPSCYECAFKKRYRVSDFTIWDAFDIRRFSKELDNDKGVTRLLIHTERGRFFFNHIRKNFRIYQTTAERLTEGVKEMFESVGYNKMREAFFTDIKILTGAELFQKYFPDTVPVKLERFFRRICCKMGIYSFMKRLGRKLAKR